MIPQNVANYMNILILGGNGFVGSHLADALLLDGHKIRILDKSPEKFRAPLKNVDYRIGDFTDADLLASALEKIDFVFHTLSTTVPATSNLNPKADVQNNLVGTIGLLDEMVKAGVEKITFLSSGGTVYGNSSAELISENEPLNPVGSSYAISKTAIENYLFLYGKLHGIEPSIFRVSNLYGPRYGYTGVQGIITTFLDAMKKGEHVRVWGDGSAIRDYIFIDDLIILCVLAVNANRKGVYNVGSGVGHSILDVIGVIEKVLGKKADIKFDLGKVMDIKRVVLDIGKARRVFGWEPKISLEEGIRSII
jgi:UDP-glucose 4-epimerase